MKRTTLCAAAALTLGLFGAACDRNQDSGKPGETRTTGATVGPSEQLEPVDRSSATQPPPAVPRSDETATPQSQPESQPQSKPQGATPAVRNTGGSATIQAPAGRAPNDRGSREGVGGDSSTVGPGHITTPPDRDRGTRGTGESNTNGSHDMGSSTSPAGR